MTSPRIEFKRMVVGLPQSMANQSSIEAAADLAEFLHIELLATFVAESSLHGLAGLSAVRELRTLDQGWQAIDAVQIARDIDHATSIARRRFAKTVSSRSITTSFDVVTGAEAMGALIRADDIVAIIEPSHPGESITRQFTSLLDAALETASGILVVPRRIAHAVGPIMALATGPDDASIRVALEIAGALKERLILVTRLGALLSAEILADAKRLGVQVERIAANEPVADARSLLLSSSRMKERLRVLTRSPLSDDVSRLFSMLHEVPLLVVQPDNALTKSP